MKPSPDGQNTYQIWVQGQDAFRARVSATECPFAFRRSTYWPSDYEGFNRHVLWKLTAWMDGWLKAQKEATSAPSTKPRP
jgi:hypothetical protein